MKLFILIISFLAIENVCAQQFNNALLVPSADSLNKIAILRPKPAGIEKLPKIIDLSLFLPKAGMQGYTQGSCTAWAVCYGMMTYLKAKEVKWSLYRGGKDIDEYHVYSPAFLYNVLKNDNSCRRGIALPDALDYCVKVGALSLNKFPYDPDRCNRLPSPPELSEAGNNKLLSYNKVFDAITAPLGSTIDIESVKSIISDSLVIPIGVQLDNSFINQSYGNRSGPQGSRLIWNSFDPSCEFHKAGCYHAMLCVGYDENISAFKVLNSWDTTFGNGGYVWISYDVFRQSVKEAYSPNIKPNGVVLATLNAEKRANLVTGKNYFSNVITDTSWVKSGYFRQYANLRIGCQYLNANQNYAVMQLSDANSNNIISTIILNIGEDYRIFEYLGHEIKIKATKIGHAGINPFKLAVYYDMSYKNLSGNSFF